MASMSLPPRSRLSWEVCRMPWRVIVIWREPHGGGQPTMALARPSSSVKRSMYVLTARRPWLCCWTHVPTGDGRGTESSHERGRCTFVAGTTFEHRSHFAARRATTYAPRISGLDAAQDRRGRSGVDVAGDRCPDQRRATLVRGCRGRPGSGARSARARTARQSGRLIAAALGASTKCWLSRATCGPLGA